MHGLAYSRQPRFNTMVADALAPSFSSWSSGRVQDSGLGSRSSPEFNTLPVRLLVVPLSKALHAALLLSTQEQSGYLWGQICKPWRQVACERLYTPQGVEMDIQMDMECKGPMTREGTCQSLQSRALSLDVDSKQWLYFTLPSIVRVISIHGIVHVREECPCIHWEESQLPILFCAILM